MLTVFKWTNKNRIFRISNVANPDPWPDLSIIILIHISSMNLFKRHTYYFIILIRFFSICIVFKIIQKSRTFFLKIKEKRDTIYFFYRSPNKRCLHIGCRRRWFARIIAFYIHQLVLTSAPECPKSPKSPIMKTILVKSLDCNYVEGCSLDH